MEKDFSIYEGFYKSFSEVEKLEQGHSGNRWLDAQAATVKSYRDDDWNAVYPADQYLAMTVYNLAIKSGRAVRILDIGGGLGGSYFWLKKVLATQNNAMEYLVVENQQVVDKATDMGLAANNDELGFSTSVPEQDVDIVYFGSSIQYFEDWQKIITRAAQCHPGTILFSRTPLSEKDSYVTAQNYYESRIPVKVIGMKELSDHLSGLGYGLKLKNASGSPVLGRFMEFPCRGIPQEYRFRFPVDILFEKS